MLSTGVCNVSGCTNLLLGPLSDSRCHLCFPQDGSEEFYSFTYQIKEGNCSVQSGLDWQDCDFKNAEEAVSVLFIRKPQPAPCNTQSARKCK